jgi:hypothetical protein
VLLDEQKIVSEKKSFFNKINLAAFVEVFKSTRQKLLPLLLCKMTHLPEF